MTRFIKQITWARWKLVDPYMDKYWTNFTLSVAKPSFEYPAPTVLMSIVNGGGRTFMRFRSLDDLRAVFVVPAEYTGRLSDAWTQAVAEANTIQKQLKAIMHVSDLSPGSQIVRTDTGEIIAEAERIIKDSQQ
jgi:hypothetical protein